MKDKICVAIGIAGGYIASLFGGWDAALKTLILFMAVDYVTGLMVAGIFHNSRKSETGSLESLAGWKGLCRKGVSLLIVLVACRLDLIMGSSFIRDATVVAFVANETISIIENAGLMGVPIPEIIVKSIEVLKNKAEKRTVDLMSTLITFKAGDKTPITKNFTRNEFQCSCGCSAQMVDEMLVQKLQTIRTVYDTPLRITSGYRCVKHNAAVGGAKSSKHLYGIAADVKDPTGKLNPVALAILASNTFGGVGVYWYGTAAFVHVDVRKLKQLGFALKRACTTTLPTTLSSCPPSGAAVPHRPKKRNQDASAVAWSAR